jgi:hypothetical protein
LKFCRFTIVGSYLGEVIASDIQRFGNNPDTWRYYVKRPLLILPFFILSSVVVISLNLHRTFADEGDEPISIQAVLKEIDSIKTYHVLLKTKIYPPDASDLDPSISSEFDPSRFMAINTTVFGESGSKMKILTKLNQPPQPPSKVQIDFLLIFDGTWLWVEQKMKAPTQEGKTNAPQVSAMKIRIDAVSPDPAKEPFNTFYGISGTGLFRYRDLPGTLRDILTSYDLVQNVNAEPSEDIVFSGLAQRNELKNVEGTSDHDDEEAKKKLHNLEKQSTQFCKVWFSPKSKLVTAYSFGKSEARPTMHTNIEYISVNEKLPGKVFEYIPPEGVQVRDATDSILQRMK